MIGRLRGIILDKNPRQVLLDIHGIGYEVQLPITCFYSLPDIGNEATIFTHCIILQDIQYLFGFINQQERELFRELIKVNSVGPKLALAILSGISLQEFCSAIEHQKIKTLAKLPGVGKKIAARLVIDIKDRLKTLSINASSYQDRSSQDAHCNLAHSEIEAISALIALGYKPKEAKQMITNVIKTGVNSEMLIRDALRYEGKDDRSESTSK